MNNKTLAILAAVTLIVVVIAAQMTRQENTLPEPEKVFPELIAQVDNITRITVQTAVAEFNLEKQADDSWGLKEKSNYPADLAKVRQTVLGITDMMTIEAKTRNPELHERLGLRDVTVEGSRAVLITLSAGETTVAEILVGNQQTAKTDSTRREFYVRKPNEDQTWLTISSLALHRQLLDWVEQEIINLDRGRVKTVEITHPDGDTLTVFKNSEETTDYQLADMPPRHKVSERYVLNQIGGALSFLRMDDVKPASELDFSTSVQAVFTTFNGLQVTMRVLKDAEQDYITFNAVALPTTATTEPAAEDSATDTESPATEETLDPTQEAAVLNATLANWAFVLPSYKAEHFYKKMTDLIEAVETAESGQGTSITGALDALAQQPFSETPTMPEVPIPFALPEVTAPVSTASTVTEQAITVQDAPTEASSPTEDNTATVQDAVTTTPPVDGQITDEVSTPTTAKVIDSQPIDTAQPESTLQLPTSMEVGHVGTH